MLIIISTISQGRQTATDRSWKVELQCGHVEVAEEVEKDPDGVSNASTPGAASLGFGSSSNPITGPFFLAMVRRCKGSFCKYLRVVMSFRGSRRVLPNYL